MTTLYKKGSQYCSKFDGVEYSFDITKTKDDRELAKLLKNGWHSTLPETVKKKTKAKTTTDK